MSLRSIALPLSGTARIEQVVGGT